MVEQTPPRKPSWRARTKAVILRLVLLVLALVFAFLALSIAGQRLAGWALRVKPPIRPLVPFAPGTPPLHQLTVRLGGVAFTWVLLTALTWSAYAREERFTTRVDVVPDYPAAQAGLVNGDVVLKVDGQPVADFFELKDRLGFSGSPEKRLLVLRGEQELTFTIVTRDGLAGLKASGELKKLTSGAALRRALEAPVRVLRVVPLFFGAPSPEGAGGSTVAALRAMPNPLVWVAFSAALAWWGCLLLEGIAFAINALAARK